MSMDLYWHQVNSNGTFQHNCCCMSLEEEEAAQYEIITGVCVCVCFPRSGPQGYCREMAETLEK